MIQTDFSLFNLQCGEGRFCGNNALFKAVQCNVKSNAMRSAMQFSEQTGLSGYHALFRQVSVGTMHFSDRSQWVQHMSVGASGYNTTRGHGGH